MDNREFALFKRCMDWYSVDPNFRLMMNQKPEETVKRLGFSGKVNPELTRDAIWYLLFRTDERGTAVSNPYVVAFEEYQRPIVDWVQDMHSREHIASETLYKYLDAQRERCRMESELIRNHPLVYYFPFGIELSHGCRMQCPFCGFKAEKYTESFLYTADNARLFREILMALKEYTGDIGGCCPAYFATEPLDNPDYEKFLLEIKNVFGHMPQTTTAAADVDPVRVKRFMAGLPEKDLHEQALFRFSIRSLAQFREIMAHYSPEDLLYVELLANNPESVNMYSDSGRVREAREKEGLDASATEKAKSDNNCIKKVSAAYSIDCVAGLKINMVDRIMAFIEPVVPNDDYPLGYRVLGEDVFTSGTDFKTKFEWMVRKYVTTQI